MNNPGSSLSTLRIIYVVTTVFLVFLSVYAFLEIKNLIDSSNWVNHTNQVNFSLQKISTAVVDAETNQKSFILINDSASLLKRDSALIAINKELIYVESLIKDNPEQIENLTILQTAINKRLVSLKKTMDDYAPLQINGPFKLRIAEGMQKTNDVKQVIHNMLAHEEQLLQQRSQKYFRLAVVTPLFIIVLFLGALFILLISYFRINNEYQKAKQAERLALENATKLKESLVSKNLLAESEARYHHLIYSSPSAIGILYGEDLVITIANPPIIAIWGKDNNIIGKKYFEALPELEEQGYKEVFAKVYKTGIPFNAIETPVSILQNGEVTLKYYNFVLYPQRNILNEIDGIGIIATEVTSQALLNNAIKESENRYRELAKSLEEKVKARTIELNRNNIELEKTNKELQSFAYISSHDLQEPLRKIQTFATRIIDIEGNNLSESGKDNFKRIQDSAKRMQTLINDLLAYSRTNTSERKFELMNLQKIIDGVKEDIKEELQEKNATIIAVDLCDVNIIPFQFYQLMHNLIGNSLKFSLPDIPPQIEIKSSMVDGTSINNPKLSGQKRYCHISVSDNGIGFEQQYSEKIFEVFQRLHGRNEYKGTGIGLSIVKKIVENHEGIITVKSELNQGAIFDIYIPAV